MVPVYRDRCDKPRAGDAGCCPRSQGAITKSSKDTKSKRWYEKTSVTLCVAAALVVLGIGFIHVITGVEPSYALPFDISRKASFGYRETFVNAERILALPYIVAKAKYPIGCRVLQDKGYMSSGRDFETRAVVQSWDNIKRWQDQFDKALGSRESFGQEPWREWPESTIQGLTEAREYNQRGITLAKTAQYAEAIAEFSRAIHKAPAQTEAYHNRALVHIAIGNLGQAAEDFGKIIEIEPERVEGYLRRSRLYMAANRYDKAIADFTQIIKIDPRRPDAYFKRALAYYAEGQYDRARIDINKLPSLNVLIPSEFLAALEKASGR